ncbi:hypothetical protein JW868_02580, partial [Candidatus Woesearchaeota archaeon]|nr:hypothetical protein [Candidatus Woesearchaeota archaeon]
MMIPPFYFREGPVANNVSELREVLQQLEPGQISQYVNYEKNDFANWAEHGLKDPELAEKLKAALEPTEVMNVLNNVLG